MFDVYYKRQVMKTFRFRVHQVLVKTWAADIYLIKNDPSYEFIGEVILKINIFYAEKIKAEVYVNQNKSLCDLQTLIKHSFILYFAHEFLINAFFNSDHKSLSRKNCTKNTACRKTAMNILKHFDTKTW
jgi:hypothetical protein